ncbi:MAG TPA: ATP-binding protein [Blastocatellia bacterium]|nr:ATP-binding protein [Blastocatellia bacterium]
MFRGVHSPQARYAVALASVVVAVLLTFIIEPLRTETQTPLFFAAVVMSARLGSMGPGLLATFLSTLAINFFFLNPVFALEIQVVDLVRMAAFLLVAVLISSLTASHNRKEEALRESEKRFRTMADSAPVMIRMTEPDRLCTYFNKGWLDFTGRDMKQEMGNGWTEGVHRDDIDLCLDTFVKAFEARQGFEMEYRLRRHDGEYRWVMDRGVPVRTPDGGFGGYIGSCIDITERKQIEGEREQLIEMERGARKEAEQTQRLISELLAREQAAREEAEKASRTKDEFLATISHELRTPLNAMLGWAGMLRSGKLDANTSTRALEIIERNARSQAQLIEDILDVSRIITGRLRLKITTVDLANVIQAAIDIMRPAIEAKEINIQSVLDPGAGPVSGDSNRLQQIVWNLLSNAVKFTPRGGRVQVRLERINSHIQISVSDTGQGISPEFLPYVFDRFRQADSSFSRKHGGLGLGLAIVRHIAELHGGTVEAFSEGKDRGAIFRVNLPIVAVNESDHPRVIALEPKEQAAPGAVWAECNPSLEGLSLLVVEDEADARELLVTMLEQRGAQVRAVATASEALEAIKHSKPDLLLSDIEMPGEDGYSLIRKVRLLGGDVSAVPAVALTAHTRVEDRTRALSSGFQSHLAKPVNPGELIAVIARLARKSRAV